MNEIELIGGPFDGACAEDGGELSEGDHIVIETDDWPKVIYTLQEGCLKFDASLTFGRTAA